MPPTLVRASPARNGSVILTDRGAVVYIVVADQDNAEELTFLWEMSGSGILSGAQTIPDGANRRASQIQIPPEARFAGETLTVIANDNSGTTVVVSWLVEISEGALE